MFTLENEAITVVVSEYGATLVQIEMKNRQGVKEDILLSLDDQEEMKNDLGYYFGKTVGPIANRIKNAHIGDLEFKANNGPNLNHSGEHGWSAQKWQATTYEEGVVKGVRFELTDQMSGFPAQKVFVDYQLTESELTIRFTSEALADSYFNPTNHAYWNLSGNAKKDICEQFLQVSSSQVLAVDENTLPTGEILSVEQTGYDFQNLTKIGDNLKQLPTGLDNTFILTQNQQPQLVIYDNTSGRKVLFNSNRQAVILYSATMADNPVKVNGQRMSSNLGLAIEFQEQPDIINHPKWGSIQLLAGETAEKYVTMHFEVE
ncbi:MAG: galactose mutarotase [Streptococcaceae bacterium]|jgi:aldose 1-epimerase|nr:galactose mutarotase [Streptococcaceae bacterium]